MGAWAWLKVPLRRARPWLALAFAALVLAGELWCGLTNFENPHYIRWPLIVASIGIGLSIGVDWLRPPGGTGAALLRRFLTLWALAPYLYVLSCSAWLHYQKRTDALDDFEAIAKQVDAAVATKLPAGDVTGEATPGILRDMLDARFPGESKAETHGHEAERFHGLIRVAAIDLALAHDELAAICPPSLRDARSEPVCFAPTEAPWELARGFAERETATDFALALVLQSVFVIWLPLLLAVQIYRAARSLERGSTDPREHRILAESQRLFLPRFCFGALLVLGTNYVFCPFGLKATYLFSITQEQAPPGHTSLTLWSTSFSEAPVVVVGFVGFLIYAFITATQRAAQRDLDDQTLLALLVRGLIVILLGFALSTTAINDTAARSFIFIAGVFPLRGLEALGKRLNVKMDPELDPEMQGGFAGLPQLDPGKAFALRAAGIQSTYDLAALPVSEIVSRVRIDPRLLRRAVDRAILIDVTSLKFAQALDDLGVTTATELVDEFKSESGAADIVAKLGEAARRAVHRLEADERLKNLGALGEEPARRFDPDAKPVAKP